MTPNPAEFQLCVQCCKWAFAGGAAESIHELCGSVDWNRFTDIARFHRVQGLVWNSLWASEADVPAAAVEALSSEAKAIAAANLQIAAEARDLRAEFEQAGVALLFVKGLTVGALAYPKPFLKMGWDIDLLIDHAQLGEAVELLRARGYERTIPAPATDLNAWHARRKESVWARDGELYVELHSRLADNRQLIPAIAVHSPRQDVELAPGIVLPTLARDELFAYLCVHGASSAWFRLKWITDLAALLHQASDIDHLYERSQELGAHRAVGQALLLADRLYGTLGQSLLKDRLLQDRATQWLADAAYRQLVSGNLGSRDPTTALFGTWRIHLTQLLLKPGPGFKINELYRQTADAIA